MDQYTYFYAESGDERSVLLVATRAGQAPVDAIFEQIADDTRYRDTAEAFALRLLDAADALDEDEATSDAADTDAGGTLTDADVRRRLESAEWYGIWNDEAPGIVYSLIAED